jgi:hypothetical protein
MRSSAIYAADPDLAYDRERQREIDDSMIGVPVHRFSAGACVDCGTKWRPGLGVELCPSKLPQQYARLEEK